MPLSEQALILAPNGRDAAIAAALLREAGLASQISGSLDDFVTTLGTGIGYGVVTEESLASSNVQPLARFLAEQEEWSDLPFILLTTQGGGLERNPASARHLDLLGNVTFLERPFHPTTFVSLARSALRARRRQYDARARMEAIRNAETQLRVALSAARLGTWTLDIETLELRTSGQCKQHYGRLPDDPFTHKDMTSSVHPDDWRRVLATMREVADGAEDYETEYRVIWPDGSVHWLEVKGRLDYSSAGMRRMSGVSLDITADKIAQVALARSEDRFRAAVEAVKGVLWTNSADGRMVGEQPGWAALTGQSFAEYQDYGWTGAVHPDDAKPTVDAWRLSVADSKPFVFEHRVRKANGEWGHFSIRAIPARDDDGSIREWVGVHTDITEQRNAERALAELAATLEQRVVAATGELQAAEENLRQVQKLETIGQLTGGVAHDFNNLLTPIVSSLDLLQRRAAGDEKSARLAAAGLQSAERAKILVNRLLSFSRRQALEVRATDIAGLLEGMHDLISRSIGPTIPVRIELQSDLPQAMTDPNQLELAILNLCVNARDAMPEGGEIRIIASREDHLSARAAGLAEGDYVCVMVADTGHGMDAETLNKAIEPFYTTKGVGKGTGLGLSMVHGLAAQLEGGMHIESQVGEGTRIRLYLPIANATDATELRTNVGQWPMPSRSATILLVDDEELVRFATAEMLREAGYDVHAAGSATEALETIRHGLAPDVLVTDQLMPGTKGAELAKQVLALRPDLPVLITTGYADLQDLGYPRLAKPFSAAELVERVRQLVEG